MEFDLIITIVNRGYSDLVMEAAKTRGAKGGTITSGRGTGDEKIASFFNMVIQPEKELVWILVPTDIRNAIMEEISARAGLKTPGQGIAFSMPVDQSIGLEKTDVKAENL
ncbi:MAG: P-II family nitrogen regulator [Clostridia bacterium]